MLSFDRPTAITLARDVRRPAISSSASIISITRSSESKPRRASLATISERSIRSVPAVTTSGQFLSWEFKPPRSLGQIWTELDPVDYRLEQISSSGIGQQALPQALCFSQ